LPDATVKQELPWLSRISRGWKAYQKSFTGGKQHAREALELFAGAADSLRAPDNRENLPLALDGMGAALHLLGSLDDLKRADKCYDEEIRLLGKASNPQELAQAISSQQAVLRDLAVLDPSNAFTYLEKGLRIGGKGMTLATKSRDERSLAALSHTTADLCCVLARLDRACAPSHLEAAVDLYEKAGALWDRVASRGKTSSVPKEAQVGKSLTLLGLAEAHIMLGKDLERARELLNAVRDFYGKSGGGSYQMGHLESLYGSLALAEGNMEEAEEHLGDAKQIWERLGFSADRGEESWK
jgi:hypothetical protein